MKTLSQARLAFRKAIVKVIANAGFDEKTAEEIMENFDDLLKEFEHVKTEYVKDEIISLLEDLE